jgi:hypothetical protein
MQNLLISEKCKNKAKEKKIGTAKIIRIIIEIEGEMKNI